MDYDIFVLVETWLNDTFLDGEFFDENLYCVFRKDRDAIKTGLSRGGGILIAIQRKFRATFVPLPNDNSVLDLLCIALHGSPKLLICSSYIPPTSGDLLYKEHVDNILALTSGFENVYIIGDFNLSNLEWSTINNCRGLHPKSINTFSETYLVDGFLKCDLSQINSFNNTLNKILDLIFISDNMNFSLQECLDPLSTPGPHYVPLILRLEFYRFSTYVEDSLSSFCFKNYDIAAVNTVIESIDWDTLFTAVEVDSCFNIFKSNLNIICSEHIPRVKKQIYKIPWFNRELKKLKNLRNRFFKKFKKSNSLFHKEKYLHYSKEFKSLSKVLKMNYVRKFEADIKLNPKAFWRYVKSKKSCSSIPSAMFYNDTQAVSSLDAANLFADFFSSNFESDSDVSCDDFLPADSSINFGALELSLDDVEMGIRQIKLSSQTDVDGFSSHLLKNCSAISYPLWLLFNKSLQQGKFIEAWKLPPRLLRVAFVACLILVLITQIADSAQTKTRRRLRRPTSTSVSSAASESTSSNVVSSRRVTKASADEIEKRIDQQPASSSSSATTTVPRARGRSKSKLRSSAASAVSALVASSSTLKSKKTKADDGGMKIVCYYTNWSQYRVKIGKFVPEDIPADLCTHIIFAFGWLKKNKLSSYESNDEAKDNVPGLYDRMMLLKKANPKLKILLALGGWSFGTQKFKEMSATRYTRQTFIYSAIPFLRKRGFDGLDMDWEYPKGSDDKKNFVLLLKELREAFEAEAQELKKQRLLLTAAVPVGPDNIRGGYDVPAVASYLDFINLMAYDFHGKWERETGHNAPLYAPSTDSEWRKQLSVDNAASLWVKMGAPKEKLVIGMPTYGRSFTLSNADKHGPNAPATGGGKEGVYTKESGFLAYYEICEMLLNGAVYVWDDEMKVPYMVDGDQWVGFDDERAIRNKMHWIKSNGYGGAMVWTIDMDDFKGEVCGGKVKYPLIGAMREELLGISRGKEAKDVNWTAVAATFADLEEEELEKPAPIKIDVEEILSKVRKPSKKQKIKSGLLAKAQNTRPAQVFCYLTSWSAKRPGAGKFLPANIDPKLCTHVVYAFASLKDHKLSEATDDDPENYEQVIALREENPDLQILLAIGGWAFGSKPFKELTSNVFRMNQFVYEAIEFLRDYKFNGLDVDWEYPRGAEDRAAYVNLLRELRVAFEGEAKSSGQPRLLLTAAVPASFEAIAAGYDVPEISKYLDFINVMTYDFHGQWERTVGHNSPLFPLEAATGYQKKLTVDFSAREWVKQGAPKEKLLIGMPTYGRSFELVNETQFDIGAPASGGGKAGKFTNEAGFLSYYEVCSFLAAENTTLVWDSEQQVPFAYRGNQWVGFDDERSLKTKMEWLKEQGFGGIMVWSVDMDDFSGRCGAGKYPLLNALNDELKEYKIELEYDGPYESHGPRGAYTTKDPHDVTCEEEDGHISYHKDWNDCTHYYMCEGERKHHMPCPANLVFNPQENVCDWPENVEGCHAPTEAPA